MKAIGLFSLLFASAALASAPIEARAGAPPAAHPALRPPLVAPAPHQGSRPPSLALPRNGHEQNGWDCNRRRFAGGAFYGASWGYSAYLQPDAPAPDAPPPPVVNYVFVEAPAAAPSQERLGPRFIAVDRRTFARPRGARPLVIYGNTLY